MLRDVSSGDEDESSLIEGQGGQRLQRPVVAGYGGDHPKPLYDTNTKPRPPRPPRPLAIGACAGADGAAAGRVHSDLRDGCSPGFEG